PASQPASRPANQPTNQPPKQPTNQLTHNQLYISIVSADFRLRMMLPELCVVEGTQRRDLSDVLWQVAERRGCDEIVIRYDCGHALRAQVLVPAVPKIREYGTHVAERHRFAQHSLHVLTRNPGASQIQVTIPEGRCRHCGRGQRQTMLCGAMRVDVSDPPPLSGQDLAQAARRLDLPLSSHAFLALLGQVCQLPESPGLELLSSFNLASCKQHPFEGAPLPQAGLRQWTRQEVEEELEAELVKYFGCAALVLLLLAAECLYLLAAHLGPQELARESNVPGSLDSIDLLGNATMHQMHAQLSNLSSVSNLELSAVNSTWVLSALTLAVHKAFGPGEGEDKDSSSAGIFLWTSIVHPTWVGTSVVLAQLLGMLEWLVALPRFILLHVVLTMARGFIWRPCCWVFSVLVDMASGTAVLWSIPTANPIAAAVTVCLLVAAVTSPVPPSLALPDVLNLELVKHALEPLVQRLRVGTSACKDGRAKAGGREAPAKSSSKDREKHGQERGKDGKEPGKPGKSHAGKDGPRGSTSNLVPACFVCLDRPSHYVLEPCGHRVVCGDCAVQLVEAAARSKGESFEKGAHHQQDRGGGTCPSCGMVISRAMRIFS
ncbi:unnamed protein product, partial [Polarella glacialis]